MTRAAIRPRLSSRRGALGSTFGVLSASTSDAARPVTDGVSRGNSVASWAGAGCVRPPVSLTRHATAPAAEERGDGTEHEHELDPAEHPRTEGPDRRTDEQAAHLRRPIEAERLAATLRRRGVGQVATGRRVVHRRGDAGRTAQDDEREWADQEERQKLEDPGQQQATDHPRDTGGPVRKPAEDGLCDETSDRPRGDDEAERGQVQTLFDEVERQDGDQATEPQPHDELGGQERDDIAPLVEPGWDAGALGVGRHGSLRVVCPPRVPGRAARTGARSAAQDDRVAIIGRSCPPPGCSPSASSWG